MKFLIIGASGFVGKYTLAHAKSLGYETIGTQSQNKNPKLVTFNLLKHNIKDCVESSFFKKGRPVFCIICAAIRQIDQCFQDKKISYKINVEKTISLIRELKSFGVKPVYLSSSFVFDGKQGYYVEADIRSPVCEYGRQKVAVEDFIKKEVPDALVFRPDKIIGDNPLEDHLFSEWYHLIKKNKSIACIQGQLFSPILVNDVAKAIVLGCKKKLSGIYHIANSEFFTRDELAKQFAFTLGRKAEIISKPAEDFEFADPRPLKTYLDSTKFFKATGMKFTTMREVFNTFINKIRVLKS